MAAAPEYLDCLRELDETRRPRSMTLWLRRWLGALREAVHARLERFTVQP